VKEKKKKIGIRSSEFVRDREIDEAVKKQLKDKNKQ
jgi:hypothetical protein